MCLSKVFVRSVDEESVIVDEASKIVYSNDAVEINTLFGEKKVLKGHVIKEVDLIKNQIILGARE
jgi:predicted RNA-binding protein